MLVVAGNWRQSCIFEKGQRLNVLVSSVETVLIVLKRSYQQYFDAKAMEWAEKGRWAIMDPMS